MDKITKTYFKGYLVANVFNILMVTLSLVMLFNLEQFRSDLPLKLLDVSYKYFHIT